MDNVINFKPKSSTTTNTPVEEISFYDHVLVHDLLNIDSSIRFFMPDTFDMSEGSHEKLKQKYMGILTHLLDDPATHDNLQFHVKRAFERLPPVPTNEVYLSTYAVGIPLGDNIYIICLTMVNQMMFLRQLKVVHKSDVTVQPLPTPTIVE